MNYENLTIETLSEGIALLTINRPSKLNALNKATIAELHQAFKVAENDSSIRVIILTGSGEKAFAAGADIAEFTHFTAPEGEQLAAQGQKILFNFVQNLSTPVIAAINGFALGGGLELAMACHFRIASENAKMGLPEVSLGVIPGYGGTQRLPQLIGKGKAMELIMTAEMMDAKTSLDYHLVNYVVPQIELITFAENIAKKIIKNSPKAIAQAIKAINANFETNINGYEIEIKNFGECFATHDFKEGTTAFLEKRKPNFNGN